MDEEFGADSAPISEQSESEHHNGAKGRVKGVRTGKPGRNTQLLAALACAIRNRRLAHHITQDELANATGLDRSYIVSIEQGKRNISISKLVQIAGELGLQA